MRAGVSLASGNVLRGVIIHTYIHTYEYLVMPRGSWGLSLALACGVLLSPVQTRGDLALGLGLWVDLGALFLSTI